MQSFFPPHIEDLSAQVKGIQSRGVVEGKARERKIWHNPEREIGCCLLSCFLTQDLINKLLPVTKGNLSLSQHTYKHGTNKRV